MRQALAQFPELELRELRPLGEGWDRSVWLVDGAWVFGFARRDVVLAGIEREREYLPRLAPLLPLPIPVPRFAGSSFFGSAYLPGAEAVGLDDATRAAVGVDVARFLRRLHGADVLAAVGDGLPLDPNARTDMRRRVPMAREALAELGWSERARGVLDEAEHLPPPAATAVAHGDLHFRHVLVEGGRASGVIDWIDLCRADPAIDLQLYWSLLTPDARPAFADAYGPIGDDQLLRARVLALSLSAELARYGRAEGHDAVAREALAALERTLTG